MQEKLEFFMDGASLYCSQNPPLGLKLIRTHITKMRTGAMAIVKQLLTIQNLQEKGGVDGSLVRWQGFLGSAAKTKNIFHPIVFVSIIINATLILGFNHESNHETFSPATYSRWPVGYYILLVLAPIHFFLSVGSFVGAAICGHPPFPIEKPINVGAADDSTVPGQVAFLRIDVTTLLEMQKRKAQREAAKKVDVERGFEALPGKSLSQAMGGMEAMAGGLQSAVEEFTPFGIGAYFPIERIFILRNNFTFWWSIIMVVMSCCGTLLSPLYYSFHLLRIAQLPEL